MKKQLREYMKKIGRKGGKAAASKLTPEQRRERGQAAVQNRWKGHTAKRRPRSVVMSAKMRARHNFPGSRYANICPTCNAQPFEWCVSLGGIPRPGTPHAGRCAPLPSKSYRDRVKP